jgi:hypothetical protein
LTAAAGTQGGGVGGIGLTCVEWSAVGAKGRRRGSCASLKEVQGGRQSGKGTGGLRLAIDGCGHHGLGLRMGSNGQIDHGEV